MLYAALAFLAGITLFTGFMPLSGWQGALLLLPFLWSRRWRWLAIAAGGFLWCGWQVSALLAQQVPAGLENRDILVEGRVAATPETFAGGRRRFLFDIECRYLDAACEPWRLRARLNWYRDVPPLTAGERWRIRVRLKRPRGFANPGGFDYERWLLAARVRATGYVRAPKEGRRLPGGSASRLESLRARLGAAIGRQAGQGPEAALLRALGTGDRADMSDAQWRTLRATGTSHLMAISGLHIGLVAGLVFALVRRLWAACGLGRYWPSRHGAALAAILAALFYALLSGFQVPSRRALVMVTVFMLSGFAAQRPAAWRVWALALLLVLAFDPLSVLGPGFWLSFGAVAAILYLVAGRHGEPARWRAALRVQMALSLALLPLSWVWFGQTSLVAPLANLVAIPWVGMLVVPPLLLGLVLPEPLSGWLTGVAALAMRLLWPLLELFAGWPGSLVYLPEPSLMAILPVLLGLVCLLAPAGLPLRLPALLLLLPVLSLAPSRPAPGDVWLTVLDVGQGLAAVVQTRHRLLVFDTGPAFRSGFNTGEAVVGPFLRARGYRFIDRLVVSHADNDHAGGVEALRHSPGVGRLLSGEPRAPGLEGAGACRAGQKWQWDGVRFSVLSPPDDSVAGNDASCVLRITAADGRSLLLPGDIERGTERRLLGAQGAKLRAEVLVAPHHGSLTSSTPAFVAAVRPQLVIFATGYLNRFGFPRAAVGARYRAVGATLLDTASSGAIEVRLEAGRPIEHRAFRARRRFGVPLEQSAHRH